MFCFMNIKYKFVFCQLFLSFFQCFSIDSFRQAIGFPPHKIIVSSASLSIIRFLLFLFLESFE